MRFYEGLNSVMVVNPARPSQAVAGVLEYRLHDHCSLEFTGEDAPDWLWEQSIEVLHIEGDYRSTIFDLKSEIPLPYVPLVKDFGGKIRFQCGTVLIGLKLEHSRITPNRLRVELNCDQISRTIILDKLLVRGRDLKVDARRRFTIAESAQLSGDSDLTSLSLTVEVEEPSDYRLLLQYCIRLLSFFTVYFGCSLVVTGIQCSFSSNDSLYDLVGLRIALCRTNGPPFVFPEYLQPSFESHLAKWFELYEQMPLAFDSYIACKSNSIHQSIPEFFLMVTALEAYHRRRLSHHGDKGEHRKKLEKRLCEISELHPQWFRKLLPVNQCEVIVRNRNYVAHQSPDLETGKFNNDLDFYFWSRRLITVFDFLVLGELPFAESSTADSVVNRWLGLIDNGLLGEWRFETH